MMKYAHLKMENIKRKLERLACPLLNTMVHNVIRTVLEKVTGKNAQNAQQEPIEWAHNDGGSEGGSVSSCK